MIVGIGIRNKIKENMRKKNDSEKNTTTAVIDEDVVVLSIEEQKCEHVTNNDVEWVVDSAAPPSYYPYKRVVYHVQSMRLWYSEDG